MSGGAEPVRDEADDATRILRSLTSGGVEPPPELSCADASVTEGRPIVWF